LNRSAGWSAGWPDATPTQVAEKVGDLALAIEQAGAYLATSDVPVSTYLEILDTPTDEAMDGVIPPNYAAVRLSRPRSDSVPDGGLQAPHRSAGAGVPGQPGHARSADAWHADQ
jgi:hypothetical protein